jgi:hypothetical protein
MKDLTNVPNVSNVPSYLGPSCQRADIPYSSEYTNNIRVALVFTIKLNAIL